MAAELVSIEGLQKLENLQQLYIDWSALQTLDVSGLTNLTTVDASDQESIEFNDPCLTSINLTGCTALQTLRIDDSDFTDGGFPSLAELPALYQIDADQSNISGEVDLTNNPNLYNVDFYGNTSLTSILLGEQQIRYFYAGNCLLTETAVNNILIALDGNDVEGGEVYLNDGENAAPTGAGTTAKNNLIGKGWDVQVNIAPPGRVGIAASTDFDIVGDFTIEMFVNMANVDGVPRPYSFGVYPAANAISIENGTMYFWGNNGIRLSGTFNPTIGEWYHICVQRSGDTLKMFVDGTEIATATYADDISSQTLPLTIGYGNEDSSGFNGLMSNFRWTTSAVYNTAGFTVPTTPLTDLAGTKLLIFQGNDLAAQLVDNSGNGHDATNTGATFSTNDPANTAAGSLQMGNV